MIRDTGSVRNSGLSPVDTGKGKERLNESGIRQLDSSGPRSSLVDSGRSSPVGRSLVDTGRGARVDSGRSSLVDSGRGGQRLTADQYVAEDGQTRQRSVQPLAYGRAQLKQDVGSATTWGSIKNSLPFMGKTTYGKVLDKLKAYEAHAANLGPGEKLKQLNDLRQDCAAWRNDHVKFGGTGGASAKATAMTRMLGSIDNAIVEASYDRDVLVKASRDDAMAKVVDEFAPTVAKGVPLNAKLLFRTDTPATKALTTHLKSHTPAEYRTGLTEAAAGGARSAAEQAGKEFSDGHLSDLDATQMRAVLHGSTALLGRIIGGSDKKDIHAAAAALPQELVDTLKEVDARIQASGGDEKARQAGFASTMFLRHALPMMQQLDDGEGGGPRREKLPPSEQKALTAMSAAMLLAVNQSGEDSWGSKVPKEHHDAFRGFMTAFEQPMKDFMDAVLSR